MKFEIIPQNLIILFEKYQNRHFAEQLDYFQNQFQSEQTLMNKLITCEDQGIDQNIQTRKAVYGQNKIRSTQLPTFFQLYRQGYQDLPTRALMFMAALIIILSVAGYSSLEMNWNQGISIIIAVQVYVLVSCVNNYRKNIEFRYINDLFESKKRIKIIRNAIEILVHPTQLLVGDICLLEENQLVICDGILIKQNNKAALLTVTQPLSSDLSVVKLSVDEAIAKRNIIMKDLNKQKITVPSPVILSGSRILKGKGKMLVLAVGENAYVNKVQQRKQKQTKATPLQMNLFEISITLSNIGMVCSTVLVVVMMLRFLIFKLSIHSWDSQNDLSRIFEVFLLATCILVLSVPEGLPLSVTISLAFSLKKILEDKNLVRNIQSCETMGFITDICVDKQKILVEDKLKINRIFSFQFQGIQQLDVLHPKFPKSCPEFKTYINLTLSNAIYENAQDQLAVNSVISQLKWKKNRYPDLLKHQNRVEPGLSTRSISYEGKILHFLVGTPQKVLEICQLVFEDSNFLPYNSVYQEDITKAAKEIEANGQKVLAFAIDCGRGYAFLCLVGLQTILKQNIHSNIETIKKSKIDLRIFTKSNFEITCNFLEQIGQGHLLKLNWGVADAKRFYQQIGGFVCKKCKIRSCFCPYDKTIAAKKNLEKRIDTIANKQRFRQVIENLSVLYNCGVQQKMALLVGLRQMHRYVAITCSTYQEKLIAQQADVSFVMNNQYKSDLEQVRGISMLDNDLNTIIKSVLWGRNIVYSVKKYLTFHITANSVVIFLTMFSGVFLQQGMIKPIQLLWINLIIDNIAAFALATEPPTDDLYQKNNQERLISKKMIKKIVIIVAYQLILLLIVYGFGEFFLPEIVDNYDLYLHEQKRDPFLYKYNSYKKPSLFMRSGRKFTLTGDSDYYVAQQVIKVNSRHLTFLFNLYIVLQVFNFFSCRKIDNQRNIFEGITKNFTFLLIIFTIMIAQILLITFGGGFIQVYPFYGLHLYHWLICLGFGLIQFVISIIINVSPESEQENREVKSRDKALRVNFNLKGRIRTILHRDMVSM